MKIFKYPLFPHGVTGLSMPKNSRVLKVDNQHDLPVLWAWADESKPFVFRNFQAVLAGQDVPENIMVEGYIGSFKSKDDSFVAHYFEVFF